MISIVITNLNNYHELWFTIQSVLSDIEEEYEIIISDNGSEKEELDAVRRMIDTMSEYHPIRLVVYDKIKSCPGIRTAGMVEAKGDLICFMDGHVILRKDYFKNTVPLFNDPDVYVVYAPEIYNAEKLYEYTMDNQLKFEQSTSTWKPISEEPYPVLAACSACTMVRKEILNLFYPQDELDYIPYTMDEPNFAILSWMFGKKVLMNPKVAYAHRPWAYTPGGDCAYQDWRPLGAYALQGKEMFDKSYGFWKGNKELKLPEKHRDFIEKNAKVKFKDLREYLITNGVKR